MWMRTRRGFLGTVAAAALVAASGTPVSLGGDFMGEGSRIPMLHVTDLFRPHVDPDDHWDLACVYALACDDRVDLLGVLVDFPVAVRQKAPDAAAVAQMNYITGMTVPLMVGAPSPEKSKQAAPRDVSEVEHRSILAVLTILRESPRPVVINITGCCRDIAMAGKLDPGLFARKCARIYVNAGTGSPDEAKARKLEYNASLDASAYAAIFDLPCPVYWMPCFEEMGTPPGATTRPVMEFGTYYQFRQNEILPHLSKKTQNFFTFMYRGRHRQEGQHAAQANWLQYLLGPKDDAELARQATINRNMWCTGGFLHATGRTVTRDGEIVSLQDAGGSGVFDFDPITVACDDRGVTRWRPSEKVTNRFIFHVRDVENYQSAMTAALRSLLTKLP